MSRRSIKRARFGAIVVLSAASVLASGSTAQANYAPKGAIYGARTDHALPIYQNGSGGGPIEKKVAANGRKVVGGSVIDWMALCPDKTFVTLQSSFSGTPISPSGKLLSVGSYRQGAFKITAGVRITFTANSARGAFIAIARKKQGGHIVTCKSPKLHFSATRAFAGTGVSVPVGPTVAVLNSAKTSVDKFTSAAGGGHCSDGSPFNEFVLIDTPMAVDPASGAFGTTATRSATTRLGSQLQVTTTVSGTVSGSVMRGTVQVSETITKKTGAVTTCQTDALPFVAKHH